MIAEERLEVYHTLNYVNVILIFNISFMLQNICYIRLNNQKVHLYTRSLEKNLSTLLFCRSTNKKTLFNLKSSVVNNIFNFTNKLRVLEKSV